MCCVSTSNLNPLGAIFRCQQQAGNLQYSKGHVMSQRNQPLLACLVLLLAQAACSQPATGPATSGPATAATPAKVAPVTSLNFVKGSAAEAQVSAGGSVEAVVTVTVQSGYHVNANPPSDAYLKATELIVPPKDGITVGFVKYPNAATKKFSFSEKPLAVYEGEVPIKVLLKAAAAASKGSHQLAAKLNVQACDNQLCYPPGTIDLAIPVIIK